MNKDVETSVVPPGKDVRRLRRGLWAQLKNYEDREEYHREPESHPARRCYFGKAYPRGLLAIVRHRLIGASRERHRHTRWANPMKSSFAE